METKENNTNIAESYEFYNDPRLFRCVIKQRSKSHNIRVMRKYAINLTGILVTVLGLIAYVSLLTLINNNFKFSGPGQFIGMEIIVGVIVFIIFAFIFACIRYMIWPKDWSRH